MTTADMNGRAARLSRVVETRGGRRGEVDTLVRVWKWRLGDKFSVVEIDECGQDKRDGFYCSGVTSSDFAIDDTMPAAEPA